MSAPRPSRYRRFLLTRVLRTHYKCRCGALVPKGGRATHERVHEAFKEFFTAPTAEEMSWLTK